MQQPTLWTIGHGVLPIGDLVELLCKADIEAIADVRSVPFSNRAPQFDRPRLQSSLMEAGLRYRYFGLELGGRPTDDSFYDDSGHVLYRALAASPLFIEGMDLLFKAAGQKRTAVLCSEAHPAACHRSLLIGRVARLRGAHVIHVLQDGTTQQFDDKLVTQTGLPGMEEESWRSLVRVRQGRARSTFLSD